MVSSFRDVVALWPSSDLLAAEIGLGASAVRKWSQRNNIPAEWWTAILGTDKAKAAGLTAELLADFAARLPAGEPAEARP